ncbi:S-layer homology domain-containing protein [Paenibacillus lentus]|uniref:S-layer homology domain-containing protein n=1 Tax=Paenibacillus lentus TaxID=1338368 RepID=A0A3Q8S9D6_9BACL|nr:S-layer homology domain-containing protein [Paenibacillus lentus]AZK45377.1 S-layer homology domain-containing protein [Paenibacillus lentus]
MRRNSDLRMYLPNHWARPAIESLADSKLMNGFSDGSFKIPVVSAQLFHFYFGEKWKTVWNYFNRNDIPEQFKLNGRIVKVSYDYFTGILTMKIDSKSS